MFGFRLAVPLLFLLRFWCVGDPLAAPSGGAIVARGALQRVRDAGHPGTAAGRPIELYVGAGYLGHKLVSYLWHVLRAIVVIGFSILWHVIVSWQTWHYRIELGV